MFELLFSPTSAIAKANSSTSTGKTVLFLFVASLLTALSIFLLINKYTSQFVTLAGLILVASFLGVMFTAFLLKISLNVLYKQGSFYSALTTLTYGFYIVSFGMFIVSLIGLVPASENFVITAALTIIKLLILAPFIALSFSVMLKTGVTLFNIDLFTMVVVIITVYTAVFLALYILSMIAFYDTFSSAISSIGQIAPLLSGQPT